ncbi:MAG: methyltransferase domain-containing protein [Clostridia bacterium]|nr:methyltransferase domain-containing protein [Clostridia bacterium]
MQERYLPHLAAAYIRGSAAKGQLSLPAALQEKPLSALTYNDTETLLQAGKEAALKLHYFKNHDELPRVKKVMGFLKAIQPESLLDVGSGRGVFLFPFLCAFPWVPVTSVDLLPHRVQLMETLRLGGIDTLTALEQDICQWDMPENAFDVVTLLEVLEHIPDVAAAVKAAVRLARRYVVVTVPSKPDNNPEHIHLLTKDILTNLFTQCGCTHLQFDGVNGHLFLAARKE